jgi:hypothetical protein
MSSRGFVKTGPAEHSSSAGDSVHGYLLGTGKRGRVAQRISGALDLVGATRGRCSPRAEGEPRARARLPRSADGLRPRTGATC